MLRRLTPILAAVISALAAANPALSADWRDYAGTWNITGSIVAPWADPKHPPGMEEADRLIGKSVTFSEQRVAGPPPLGCSKPDYKVQVAGPDMIFEGMLAAPPKGAQPKRVIGPGARTSRMGFENPREIATLDAGCTEVQFHQQRAGLLVFGLNNRVYSMAKKK